MNLKHKDDLVHAQEVIDLLQKILAGQGKIISIESGKSSSRTEFGNEENSVQRAGISIDYLPMELN